MADRNELIVRYFQEGLSCRQMCDVLLKTHSVSIYVRHIHRILRPFGLKRRDYSVIRTVIDFLLNERTEGVRLRTAHRFARRSYFAAGPNFIWHIDGFDKLKPYGLCIHGCICGFSRKMVWLNVYTTNNNPKVIGGFFLKAVERIGGTAYMIRGDFGTENVLIKDMQNWFQRHGENTTSYLEGASTQNQRIEGWWSSLRRQHIQHWIDIFKNLQENGEFSASDIHKNI